MNTRKSSSRPWTKYSQRKLLERERKKIEMRWGGGGACSLPSILPHLQLACFLNQTAWWVLVLWVPTPPPPPPAPEPSFSVSFLFFLAEGLVISVPGISLGSDAGGRVKGESERKTEGRLSGRGRRETLNTPKLGLIYFINQDYKFNLQTRGQNFSLTRGPGRTSGLGDHSYYWLHISICLWCSMSAFLPPLSAPTIFGREVDFNCSYRTEHSLPVSQPPHL